MRKLGKTAKDLKTLPELTSVATAGEGHVLQILGRFKNPLKLKLHHHTTAINFCPIVIENLAMDINISGPFLKKHSIDQIHSKDSLKFQGKLIPLLPDNFVPLSPEITSSIAVITRDVTIQPFSETYVPIIFPGFSKSENKQSNLELMLQGSESFEQKYDCHSWRQALIKTDSLGQAICGVLNTSETPVHIPAGATYGEATALAAPEANTGSSYQVSVVTPRESQSKKAVPSSQTLQKIVENFGLDKKAILVNEKAVFKAAALLHEFSDIFTETEEVGCTDLYEHEIKLKPNQSEPIKVRARPLNPTLEDNLQQQIDLWLKQDVVEPAQSPWNFPLVPVRKKNGKVRFCVDYRELNNVTIADSFPIPHVEDSLARLGRSRIFSVVDGSGAFHCIPIKKSDRNKTAFSTPNRQWRFKRLPFGLSNGPASYARLMGMVLQGMPTRFVLAYLDDVIVHSETLEDHFSTLREVFSRHRKAGLKLSVSKANLFASSLKYLGFALSEKGLAPDPEYINVVKDWPIPTNITELRAFFGKIGYYRKFIHNFSEKAKPLSDALQTKETESSHFPLSSEAIQCFEALKKALISAPILAVPDFSGKYPFILDTDFSESKGTIGGVLSQQQPDGTERPICYAAKKLCKSQQSYSAFQGELLAIVSFIKQFKYYLAPFRFLLRTDNSALSHLYNIEAPSAMFQRYMETLANFDFEIQHRHGQKHGNADALSRIDHAAMPSPDMEEIAENTDFLLAYVSQNITETLLNTFGLDREIFIQEQKDDEDLQQVRQLVQQQQPVNPNVILAASPVAKVYLSMIKQLSLENGLLVYKRPILQFGVESHRLVTIVPRVYWYLILTEIHKFVGHKAIETTLLETERNFYFPNIKFHLAKIIKSCKECNSKSGQPSPQSGVHLSASAAGYPFQRLSLDIVGPLPRSRRGNEYLLTCRCMFSRWIEAKPMRSPGTKEICDFLEREIVSRFGCPENLHSDRGSGFIADKLSDICLALGIKKSLSPSYNPQSNMVERAHRDLNSMLTALTKSDLASWEDHLPAALFAMRITRNKTTGASPFELIFGRDPTVPLDLIFSLPQPHPLYKSYESYATELRRKIAEAHKFARQNISRSVQRQRSAYQGKVKKFEIGQKVWLFTPKYKPHLRRKFQKRWTGPWTVTKIINPTTLVIDPHQEWIRKAPQLVSIDRLKPFYELENAESIPPPANADLSMPGDEFAEHFQTDIENDDEEEEQLGTALEEEIPQNRIPPVDQDVADAAQVNDVPPLPPRQEHQPLPPLPDRPLPQFRHLPPELPDATPPTPRRSPRLGPPPLGPRNLRIQREIEADRARNEQRRNFQNQQRLLRLQRRNLEHNFEDT